MKLQDGFELVLHTGYSDGYCSTYPVELSDFEFTGKFKIREDGSCVFETKHKEIKFVSVPKTIIKYREPPWYIFWRSEGEAYVETTTESQMVETEVIRWYSDEAFELIYEGECNDQP